jgi:hypothetical protein
MHSVRGNAITLAEERVHWKDPERRTRSDIATFRFHPYTGTWELYWADRNDRWHLYEDAAPTAYIRTLLEVVDRDPTGIFWG